MAEPKKLYVAKSWPELNSMCKSKMPANQTRKQQIEFVDRMWNAFLQAKEDRDQERQCVLLLMFLEDSVTLGLQTLPEYKKRLALAIKRAEVLKDQLKLRYIRLETEMKEAEAKRQREEQEARATTPYAFDLGTSQTVKDTKLSSSGSGSSTSNPNKTVRYVQPRVVYDWMEHKHSVLLLDTRPIRVYKALHVQPLNNAQNVSVPEEVLTKNNLVSKDIDLNIGDDAAKASWAKRSTYNYVVMFDQNTTQSTSTGWHSNFPRLDRILREDGVSNIFIMNGGFREWYKLYPTQCTGTNPQMAPVMNRESAQIEYPSFGTLNQLSMAPTQRAKPTHLYPMFGVAPRPVSDYESETEESSDESTPTAGVAPPAVIRTDKPALQGPPLQPKPATTNDAPPIPATAKPITAPTKVTVKKPRRPKTQKIDHRV